MHDGLTVHGSNCLIWLDRCCGGVIRHVLGLTAELILGGDGCRAALNSAWSTRPLFMVMRCATFLHCKVLSRLSWRFSVKGNCATFKGLEFLHFYLISFLTEIIKTSHSISVFLGSTLLTPPKYYIEPQEAHWCTRQRNAIIRLEHRSVLWDLIFACAGSFFCRVLLWNGAAQEWTSIAIAWMWCVRTLQIKRHSRSKIAK